MHRPEWQLWPASQLMQGLPPVPQAAGVFPFSQLALGVSMQQPPQVAEVHWHWPVTHWSPKLHRGAAPQLHAPASEQLSALRKLHATQLDP